jgi:uncharacterized protein
MDSALQSFTKYVRNASGLKAKKQLSNVLNRFDRQNRWGFSNGDDTAVIPNGDGYDLFAMEGFIPEFVEHDPWFAGWCSVMVNLSDIASMGGVPTAVTNAVWATDDASLAELQRGIIDAAKAFDVDVVGGHTCHNSPYNQLSVAVLGKATNLMTSFDTQDGDYLLCVIDQRGEYRKPFLNWNAATSASEGRLKEDIALLPKVAQIPLVTGCKDISQGGLLGTTTMFMDCSGKGVEIDLNAITLPEGVDIEQWVLSFPSFGYLITCQEASIPSVKALFEAREINVDVIGRVNRSSKITLTRDGESACYWDLAEEPFWNLAHKE